ncbi:hypothetical protein FGLOB1_5313 [Fusarium globosum]|uniref:Uncharacterized protein n=1 Tax=Fusarium globosum TaxID=78864 RepID=A0A8H5YDW5_9HYPO|nr:hypothetical protein FGLOB1_5313 [Fusarium globosum]
MAYTHAPYISPYGPPEESGIRPPPGWSEEPTTQTPQGNTFYPPVDPQLSYPHQPQPSGFQPYNSQADGSHSTGAPVLDYQTLPPNPFSPQLHTHQPNLFGLQYNDPGSSSAHAYRSSILPNPFSSLEMPSSTENHDADLQLPYPFVEQNVDTWLQNDGDLGSWTYDGRPHGEQSSYNPKNQQTPLPIFGIRCEDCEQRRQNDAHALQLEFCLLCTADVNDPGNLMCPEHMNTMQAFNGDEKAILRENHIYIVFGNKDCVGADKSVCLGTASAKVVPILPGRRRGEEERQKYEESREVDQGKISQ